MIKKFLKTIKKSIKAGKVDLQERARSLRYYGLFGSSIQKFGKPTQVWITGWKGRAKGTTGTDSDNQFHSVLKGEQNQIIELNKIKKDLFTDPPKIIFISNRIPHPNMAASDCRLFNVLKILLKNNCKIKFLYCTERWDDRKYKKMLEGDIDFLHLPLNVPEHVEFISNENHEYIWITELWQIEYVKFATKLVEALKISHVNTNLILDTVDFHYKEYQRRYEMFGDSKDLKRANEFLGEEEMLYRNADTVVVVTEDEKNDIQNKIFGVRKIEVVPTVHEISHVTNFYNNRKNICFVGNFGNNHNVDAVRYFIDNIFHLILKDNPVIEFHIIGNLSERYKKEFNSHNVRVIGSLKDLHKALKSYKLFVCPMTYGAGMKGKIGEAISAGLPVVTTTIGAEGFPVKNGDECLIADLPEEFAEKCNQCLKDSVLWHELQMKSRLMMAENYSPSVIEKKLKNVFRHN